MDMSVLIINTLSVFQLVYIEFISYLSLRDFVSLPKVVTYTEINVRIWL